MIYSTNTRICVMWAFINIHNIMKHVRKSVDSVWLVIDEVPIYMYNCIPVSLQVTDI
jgi:hypothetical protein